MKILVDAMGGDNAPDAVVRGAVLAAKEYEEEIILIGQEEPLRKLFSDLGVDSLGNISAVYAPDIVDMHDDPSTVLRHKPHSSMAVALTMLKNGEGDAVVSAGNTGALLAGATLYAKRIKGIRRAAVAPVLPCKGGEVLLCDGGANIDCTPEYLLQFAFMGSLDMEMIRGVKNPRVGLLNNGTEDTKGDELRKETYQLLKKANDLGKINFVGNVEANRIPFGVCDVTVSDGYTGNILLKTFEGMAKYLGDSLIQVFKKNAMTKMSYLACKGGIDDFRVRFNQDREGGAPFLGVQKPVIKAHGSSNAMAIKNAIRQAITYEKSGMIQAISDNIEYMTVEKEEK